MAYNNIFSFISALDKLVLETLKNKELNMDALLANTPII